MVAGSVNKTALLVSPRSASPRIANAFPEATGDALEVESSMNDATPGATKTTPLNATDMRSSSSLCGLFLHLCLAG
jgi:hypothetical protein